MTERRKSTREQALRVARYLGCRGVHQDDMGNWLPCANSATMERISNEAEKGLKKRKGKKRRRYVAEGYEELGQRGVLGIDTLSGGGLVSGKAVIIGRARPRRGDPDVYDDPNSARLRSRALGCIGIARRLTADGEEVWTPCTNVSDFRRRTGISPLAERDRLRRFAEQLEEVGGPQFRRRRLRRFKKKDGLELIEEKAGRRARADRLAATPAPKKDRIYGSSVNKPGTARSASSGRDISIDESTARALAEKVKAHNEKMRKSGKPSWSMVTLNKLKVVYRRGAGAFSSSHRPGMARGQWALGRVNAFLKMLETGKPKNARYINDNDLLSDQHPWKARSK